MNDKELSEGLLHLCQVRLNNFFLPGSSREKCVNFMVENKHVGFIKPDVKEQILKYPDVFHLIKDTAGNEEIHLNPVLKTFDERSEKLARVLEEFREKSLFISLRGWRNECYDIWSDNRTIKILKMERSAVCLFGMIHYGVHINGYLNHPSRGLCMWIGRRALDKPTYPGQLDQMAAGGIASGHSVMETARKECQEEASIPDELLDGLKPVGSISYFFEDETGLYPEVEFSMDLELPVDFVPKNSDGEVSKFELMTIEEIKWKVAKREFKPNCGMIIMDFMFRHGIITPDDEPYYSTVEQLMHMRLPHS